MNNRTFRLNIGNEYSNPGELKCGVPQGSILGPLIFLIYVNDMPQSIKILTYKHSIIVIFVCWYLIIYSRVVSKVNFILIRTFIAFWTMCYKCIKKINCGESMSLGISPETFYELWLPIDITFIKFHWILHIL